MNIKDSNLKLAFKNLFLAKRKDCVVLEPHMGLGDSLICLGLVKTLAAKAPEYQFYFVCLPNYFHSVAWMFKDISNVFPVAVNSGREARQYAQFKNATYLPIGIQNVDIHRFDESFYEQHQVPFSIRWEFSGTPLGSNATSLYNKLNPKNVPYRLVCRQDSSATQHSLSLKSASDVLEIEVHPATNNIFDWAQLVLGAVEIHTIDTAFIHFVENTLPADTKQKLFFHRIRQSPTEFTRRLPWQEIKY
jgi:hypothetical protein